MLLWIKKKIILNLFFEKTRLFFKFFFNYYNSKVTYFSYSTMNMSWKFQEDCLKNKEEDRFLVIKTNSEKIDLGKVVVHMFVSETLKKNYNFSKVE